MPLFILIDYVAQLVVLHEIDRFCDGDLPACYNDSHVCDVGDFRKEWMGAGFHDYWHLMEGCRLLAHSPTAGFFLPFAGP